MTILWLKIFHFKYISYDDERTFLLLSVFYVCL